MTVLFSDDILERNFQLLKTMAEKDEDEGKAKAKKPRQDFDQG